jgi:L-arabinose isomerase
MATKSHGDVRLKIGFFSVGLETYWSQFEGLRDRLVGYSVQIARRLARSGVEIVDLGLIDTPQKAFDAGHMFRREDVDIIFLYVSTYALSSTVLPAVRRARVPVIVLNLSPGPAIDYAKFNRLPGRKEMTGEWLAWCQACSTPEISNVFDRCEIPFHLVNGMLEDDAVAWGEINEWIDAAIAAHVMEHNRLGAIGHYYNGMLDIYSDFTQQYRYFGGHIEIIEVEELAAMRRAVPEHDIARYMDVIRATMEVREDCEHAELLRAARTAAALDQLVERNGLGSIAYYYEGTGTEEHRDVMSSVILGASLLTARGIPVAGEYEIKNAQAMKIMDALGAGGSFTEYYAVDYNDDVILMGHDGPGHIAIAEGKTKVRPLDVFHGKVGRGLSVEMSVKHGPITLLSVVQTGDGKLKLLTAEGFSVPGPILEIGNTNSRYKFSQGAREFMQNWNSNGPAHHCAVGTGHIATKIGKLAALLEMDATMIV